MFLKTSLNIFLLMAMTFTGSYSAALQLDIWGHLKQLQLEFPEHDDEIINEINRRKENAEDLIEQSFEAANRDYLERTVNELFEATQALFDIYEYYCQSARGRLKDAIPNELDLPLSLERRAGEKMENSKILKNEAGKIDDYDRAESMYMVAFDLEQLALLNKGRALRIYQDFPIIYAYQWEEDYTVLKGTPERIIRVVDVEIYGETGQEGEGHIATEQVGEGHISPDQKGSPGELPVSQTGDAITYIVQIAAHNKEIPENELREIYGGDRQVEKITEDNWYKYYLGPYNTFEEAERVFKSIGLTNAFIAAYQNGQRISIGEARKRQEEGN